MASPARGGRTQDRAGEETNAPVRDAPPDVLVVDDDPHIRQVLHWLLVEEGYRVLDAADGLLALQLLRAGPGPFVVLLDHLMPRMTGLELLRHVERDSALAGRDRYILLSAMAQAQARELADVLRRLGVRYLAKPFDLDALLVADRDAALGR